MELLAAAVSMHCRQCGRLIRSVVPQNDGVTESLCLSSHKRNCQLVTNVPGTHNLALHTVHSRVFVIVLLTPVELPVWESAQKNLTGWLGSDIEAFKSVYVEDV